MLFLCTVFGIPRLAAITLHYRLEGGRLREIQNGSFKLVRSQLSGKWLLRAIQPNLHLSRLSSDFYHAATTQWHNNKTFRTSSIAVKKLEYEFRSAKANFSIFRGRVAA